MLKTQLDIIGKVTIAKGAGQIIDNSIQFYLPLPTAIFGLK